MCVSVCICACAHVCVCSCVRARVCSVCEYKICACVCPCGRLRCVHYGECVSTLAAPVPSIHLVLALVSTHFY